MRAVVAPAGFLEDVKQLKAELAQLHERLRAANAAGNRALALDMLGKMLAIQSDFHQRWRLPAAVKATGGQRSPTRLKAV